MARIGSGLSVLDHLGACKARWGINRMNYLVPAGLYAVGNPTDAGPVLVTANYKMSYDLVRKALTGRNVWLLVLETFGINVWCAAGKGTFGTDELVRRMETAELSRVVKHRRIILPILGAPGVAAHEVARRTGFAVSYGTIRAADLPDYLDNGMVTTPAMRELTFSLYERLVLVPVELVLAFRSLLVVVVVLWVAATLAGGLTSGLSIAAAYCGAALAGIVLAPVLLPWLPGRSFALKGAVTGLAWAGLLYVTAGGSWPWPVTIAAFLALPAVSAFYALNFTGCTTFTSRSGVKKEMRLAMPAMGLAVGAGLLLLLLNLIL